MVNFPFGKSISSYTKCNYYIRIERHLKSLSASRVEGRVPFQFILHLISSSAWHHTFLFTFIKDLENVILLCFFTSEPWFTPLQAKACHQLLPRLLWIGCQWVPHYQSPPITCIDQWSPPFWAILSCLHTKSPGLSGFLGSSNYFLTISVPGCSYPLYFWVNVLLMDSSSFWAKGHDRNKSVRSNKMLIIKLIIKDISRH